jgi:competence protein ComEA
MDIKKILFAIGLVGMLFLFANTGMAADEKQVDINIATVEELAKVPGLNPDLAAKIVERRETNGEFVDLDELLDIEGIDNNLYRSLKNHLMIDPASFCGNC